MAKGKGKKPASKAIVVKEKKEKGPVPDYKIQKLSKDDSKNIFANSIEHARARLNAAPAKDKWIYYIEYQALKQEKHNGGIMSVKHNSKSK